MQIMEKNNKIDILITVGTQAKYISKTAKELGTKEIYECKNNRNNFFIILFSILYQLIILFFLYIHNL